MWSDNDKISTFDINKYVDLDECSASWKLRKWFLLKHHDKFPDDRLVCLAQCFVNVELYGNKYPLGVMTQLSHLTEDIQPELKLARDENRKRKSTTMTFVKASSDDSEGRADTQTRSNNMMSFVKSEDTYESTDITSTQYQNLSETQNFDVSKRAHFVLEEFPVFKKKEKKSKALRKRGGKDPGGPKSMSMGMTFVRASTDDHDYSESQSMTVIEPGDEEVDVKYFDDDMSFLQPHSVDTTCQDPRGGPKSMSMGMTFARASTDYSESQSMTVIEPGDEEVDVKYVDDDMSFLQPHSVDTTCQDPSLTENFPGRLQSMFDETRSNIQISDEPKQKRPPNPKSIINDNVEQCFENLRIQLAIVLSKTHRRVAGPVAVINEAVSQVHNVEVEFRIETVGEMNLFECKVYMLAVLVGTGREMRKVLAKRLAYTACIEELSHSCLKFTDSDGEVRVVGYEEELGGNASLTEWRRDGEGSVFESSTAQFIGNSPQAGNSTRLRGNSTPLMMNKKQYSKNKKQSKKKGNSRQIKGNSAPLIGNSTRLMGNSTPYMGNSTRLTGNSTPLMGNSTPLMGNSTLSRLILMENTVHKVTAVSKLNTSVQFSNVVCEFAYQNSEGGAACQISLDGNPMVECKGITQKDAKEKAAELLVDMLQKTCWTIVVNQAADTEQGSLTKGDVIGTTASQSYGAATNASMNSLMIPESNVGHKMLQRMGWAGGGVGKYGTGRAEPVEVESVVRRSGLGLSSDTSLTPDGRSKICKYLVAYATSDTNDDLVMSPDFTNEERKFMHGYCRKLGIKSKSVGTGLTRYLVISRRRSPAQLLEHIKSQGGVTPKYRLIPPGGSI